MRNTIVPEPTVSATQCLAEPSAERCSCGKCGKTFAGGSIVSDDAKTYTHPGGRMGWVADRTVYCDHCNHLIFWTEALGAQMQRTGIIIIGPGYIRMQRKIDAFLKQHPHAAGVEQV